jgi:hypothetical protein
VLSQCTVTGTIGSLSASTSPVVQDPVIVSNTSLPAQEPAGGAVKVPSGVCAPVSTPEAPVSGALLAAGALAAAGAWWGDGGERSPPSPSWPERRRSGGGDGHQRELS